MIQERDLNKIIHQIRFFPENRVELFTSLPLESRDQVLLRLTRHIQHDIVNRLPEHELIITLEQLDPDEATDIIRLLKKSRQKEIIEKIKEELRRDVEILIQFDPKTAAGIMSMDYVQVPEEEVVAEVARRVKTHEKRTGKTPTIIAEREGKIGGFVPAHELGFARPSERIKKFIKKIPTLKYNLPHKEVIDIFKEHAHSKVAVIGENENIVGIIYSDDVLRLLEEQESASLYEFAGVHKEESVGDTVRVKVSHRYKWLIINLGTAFLAALTVGLFEETISKFVLLAVYMPIIAGMGGNAATQTLAVLVRGIALKEITLANAWEPLKRELGAGIINGLINGLLVAAVVIIFNQDFKIALILAMAMVINLFVAGFFGTMVPLVMQRLGRDPATSATIFITTATDVLGFLAFLGLATLLLV